MCVYNHYKHKICSTNFAVLLYISYNISFIYGIFIHSDDDSAYNVKLGSYSCMCIDKVISVVYNLPSHIAKRFSYSCQRWKYWCHVINFDFEQPITLVFFLGLQYKPGWWYHWNFKPLYVGKTTLMWSSS